MDPILRGRIIFNWKETFCFNLQKLERATTAALLIFQLVVFFFLPLFFLVWRRGLHWIIYMLPSWLRVLCTEGVLLSGKYSACGKRTHTETKKLDNSTCCTLICTLNVFYIGELCRNFYVLIFWVSYPSATPPSSKNTNSSLPLAKKYGSTSEAYAFCHKKSEVSQSVDCRVLAAPWTA